MGFCGLYGFVGVLGSFRRDEDNDLEMLDYVGTGVGLANLRTRLQILHGKDSALELRRADAGGGHHPVLAIASVPALIAFTML